jgi:beta-N-acetylhexosaminidase
MLHGPVMIDVGGTELSASDRELICHPATGGVILFSRNFSSPQQLYRLTRSIHELRSPHLLIAVDQEGGRVQRFRDGLTRLPPASACWQHCHGDERVARSWAHELGWLMAAELRALGVDFSFAPVADLNKGLNSVIGDRAFSDSPDISGRLACAWMQGAREAGMISVGKHFPGHGGVVADSHVELPVDERSFDAVMAEDVQPFARLIDSGLEAVMPAHVIFSACDSQPAGFSRFWLQEVLRKRLGFTGAVFSDDLSMAAAASAGAYADRAKAALEAGCDMVLVCNNTDGALETLEALRDYRDPVALSRTARLHGRPSRSLEHLHEARRWRDAVSTANDLVSADSLNLDLVEQS